MYAVIATGGKQYKAEPGQTLTVEKLAGAPGDSVELPAVMVVADDGAVTAGKDVEGRTVKATIVEHGKAKKITVFTYKNKTRQRKKRGHRQSNTTIQVDTI